VCGFFIEFLIKLWYLCHFTFLWAWIYWTLSFGMRWYSWVTSNERSEGNCYRFRGLHWGGQQNFRTKRRNVPDDSDFNIIPVKLQKLIVSVGAPEEYFMLSKSKKCYNSQCHNLVLALIGLSSHVWWQAT